MKHLRKYNENNEVITNIEQSDLFGDFHDSVIDFVESNGGKSNNIGFLWINKTNGSGIWSDFNLGIQNSIKKKTPENYTLAVNSEPGNGLNYQEFSIRMCFVANLGKIKLKGDLGRVLRNMEKFQELNSLLSRMGNQFDKLELKPFYESGWGLTLLYAQLNAEETLKIGNSLELRLPNIDGFTYR
jgi:hypothetical protein